MLVGIVAAAFLVVLYFGLNRHNRIQPLDRQDLRRLRRYSDEMYRESAHMFEY